MSESIRLSTVLPASGKEIYEAWLSSKEHGDFTGDSAIIDPKVGGDYTAGSGYIKGRTLEMEPHRRIVQSWRSTDFPPDSADSRLEVLLEEAKGGTRLTLIHSGIPDGQGQMYKQGWKDFYFKPMKEYFKKRKGS